jgi:hypothetical protein
VAVQEKIRFFCRLSMRDRKDGPELMLLSCSLTKQFGLAKEECCRLTKELYSAGKESGRVIKEFG